MSVVEAMRTLPNESRNIFVADTDRRKAPSGRGGSPKIKISWVSSRSIHLTHHKNARVFFAKPSNDRREIDYIALFYHSLKLASAITNHSET